MNGIYIKGMEMPRTHPLTITIYPNGQVLSETVGAKDIHGDAAPVPPHGRLIDADALMHEFEKAQHTMQQHGREYSCSFMSSSQEISTEWYCVEDMVENAPTVIPAEEGKR